MFNKCVTCERLGKDCSPNFYSLSVEEVRNWARRRLDYLDWSYTDLSEASGVNVKTIGASFSKTGCDIMYTTFAPMLCALVGSKKDELPCPISSEDIALKDQTIKQQTGRISLLETENEKLRSQLVQAEDIAREHRAEKQQAIDRLKQDLLFTQKQVLHKDDQISQKDEALISKDQRYFEMENKNRKFIQFLLIGLILAYLLLFDLPNPEYGILRFHAIAEFINSIFSPGCCVLTAVRMIWHIAI